MKKLTQIEIRADWLEEATRRSLKIVLGEYRFFVHRFVQWLALTLGKSNDERVRQLLLHNLVDECGQIAGPVSHLTLLDALITSCGGPSQVQYEPFPSTRNSERWFFNVFSNQDCHTCLCVLGPGTESISQDFLRPLEAGIRHSFGTDAIDFRYFDVHRAEVEILHSEDINKSIELIESKADLHERERLLRSREFWTSEAISQHAAFWSVLRDHPI